MKNTLKFYLLITVVAMFLQRPQKEAQLSFFPTVQETYLKLETLDEGQKDFILNHQKDWIREGLLSNISPTVLAGQAVLESGFGTSTLARNYNALYGVKYKRWMKGQESAKYFDTQENTKSTYLTFDSKVASIEFQTKFLTEKYPKVMGKRWSKAIQLLEDQGYATTSNHCKICNRGRYMNKVKIKDKGCEGECVPSYSSKLKFGEKIYADKLKNVILTYGLDALEP